MHNFPAPFIVGVGRSGTTLLRLMLDAHPALAIPSETLFLEKLLGDDGISKEQFLDTVTHAETWENMTLHADELRAAIERLEEFSVPEGIRCFYRLYAKHRGKERWGDKTPYYRVNMTRIARLLPEAHFIHVIRDGRDSALSYQGLWFGPGDDFEKQARFWRDQVLATRKQASNLEHYNEVRYEALVTQPEQTLRTICTDLELKFDPTMRDYHHAAEERLAEFKRPFGPADRTPRDIKTFMAIHNRAKSPPDESRIGRWRTEMSRADLERYEAIAGPLLRELGYETLT
jgi:hypothetical protein